MARWKWNGNVSKRYCAESHLPKDEWNWKISEYRKDTKETQMQSAGSDLEDTSDYWPKAHILSTQPFPESELLKSIFDPPPPKKKRSYFQSNPGISLLSLFTSD